MKKLVLLYIIVFLGLELNSQCTDDGNVWNKSWVSCQISQSPNLERTASHWLLYDFHEDQFFDSTHIWNANRIGESEWGAKEVVIDYSEDGTTWNEIGTFTLPKADETNNYTGFPGPNLEGLKIKKLLINITQTHGTSACASIAEIQLMTDKDACFGILDECGVCDGPGEITWYLDADGDGQGDPEMSQTDCDQPDGYVDSNTDLCDNGALGWVDVAHLFSDNGCNSCHGADAAGGLDLRTFSTASIGGNLCGSSLFSSNHFVQVITQTGYNGCGEMISGASMNDRSSGKFNDQELATLQKWIDGGFPEECSNFNLLIDADNDGFFADEDCDDSDPNINPDAEDIPNNGIDEDCDGQDIISSLLSLGQTQVEIFPNPTSEFLFITLNNSIPVKLELYDNLGKMIYQQEGLNSISVKKFASGAYLLKVIDTDTKIQSTQKIMITH